MNEMYQQVPAVVLVCRNSTDTAYFQRLRPYPRVMLRRHKCLFKDYDKTPIGFGVVVFCIAKSSCRSETPCLPVWNLIMLGYCALHSGLVATSGEQFACHAAVKMTYQFVPETVPDAAGVGCESFSSSCSLSPFSCPCFFVVFFGFFL